MVSVGKARLRITRQSEGATHRAIEADIDSLIAFFAQFRGIRDSEFRCGSKGGDSDRHPLRNIILALVPDTAASSA